jgi:hypothetical protein
MLAILRCALIAAWSAALKDHLNREPRGPYLHLRECGPDLGRPAIDSRLPAAVWSMHLHQVNSDRLGGVLAAGPAGNVMPLALLVALELLVSAMQTGSCTPVGPISRERQPDVDTRASPFGLTGTGRRVSGRSPTPSQTD